MLGTSSDYNIQLPHYLSCRRQGLTANDSYTVLSLDEGSFCYLSP
jgi:hypothetical protein